jgi:hypothetical protein
MTTVYKDHITTDELTSDAMRNILETFMDINKEKGNPNGYRTVKGISRIPIAKIPSGSVIKIDYSDYLNHIQVFGPQNCYSLTMKLIIICDSDRSETNSESDSSSDSE